MLIMLRSFFKTPWRSFRSDYTLAAFVKYHRWVSYSGWLVLALTFVGYLFMSKPNDFRDHDHIARIDIGSLSTYNTTWVDDLRDAVTNDRAKGIVLVIDQAMSSSGHLYEVESAMGAVSRVKGMKPVVSFVYGYALGGNYVLASETDYIVAQKTSTLGGLSIAVSSFDPKPLLERIGVDVITKGYGDLKVMPEKGAKNYDAYVSHRNSIYESLYKWMLKRVQENRRLSPQSVDKIRKGEWYLGERAKNYGLCDRTGDFIVAVDVVKKKLSMPDLQVINYSHGAAPQQSSMAVLKKFFHVQEKSYQWLLHRVAMGLRTLMIDSVDYAVRHSIVM